MRRRITIVFSLLFVVYSGYSQRKDFSVAIPSPNASSLGIYGEMPVSYFTGVPNIGVPLYELKGRSIGLSVSLSYHAGGLRPDNHPGWVGNGWALIAGGSITRKVNGDCDEYHKPFSGKHGYYYNYSNLNSGNWSSTTRLAGPIPSYTNVDGIPVPQLVDSDTEPDEFNFNFNGYAGRFFLDQTGVWQVQCDKALKVIFNPTDFVDPFIKNISGLNISSNINKTFGKFTILDEAGNKYIFGSVDANNTAIEFSDAMIPSSTGRGSLITATSWFLTKIISANGTESIDLTYERGPITSHIGYGQFSTSIDASGGGFMSMDPPCTSSKNGVFGLNGTVLFPVYLSSISMPSRNILIDFSEKSKSDELLYKWNGSNLDAYGKVWQDAGAIPPTGAPPEFPTFYADVTSSSIIPYYANHALPANRWERFIWLKLDAMYVRNTSNNTVIKQVDFWYNNDVNKRLQLNLLRLKDKNNQVIGSYSFSYNATALPGYLTIFGDHWGFNNYANSGGNNNLLPGAGGTGSTNYLTVRAPDATGIQTQAEMLTSITYPTGGTTSFIYEPNQYGQAIDRSTGNGIDPIVQSGVAGGLRIKQINVSDNNGGNYSKQYYYVKNYTAGANPAALPTSGVLDSKPQYTFNCTGTDNSGYTIYYQSISTHPIIPLTTNSSGTHIGYSEVVEYRSDGSYSIFQFSNQDNAAYRDQPCINSHNKWALGYSPIISNAYKRGKLLQRTDKDNNGNTVAEETMTYSNAGLTSTVNAVFNYWFNTCPNVGSYRAVTTRVAYQFSIQSFLPTTVVSKKYPLDASSPVLTNTVSYVYDQYKNITSQQMADSKGQSNSVSYRFPYVFASAAPDNPYQRLMDMNNVSAVIEKSVTSGNDVNLKTREISTYRMYSDEKVYQDAFYSYESATPELVASVATTVYDFDGNLTMDNRCKLQNRLYYDGAGNLSTIETKDNFPVSYLWNYNQQFPVAKVINGKNIYETGVSGNVAIQPTVTKFINGNPPFTTNYYTLNTPRTGTVTVTFAYNNPYISGTNSTNISVQLIGVSNSYFSSTSLCAKTIYNSGGCTNNTYSFTNVPPGTYSVQTYIFSVTGFTNYYGYLLSLNYPSYKYSVVTDSRNIAYTSFETDEHGRWANVNAGNIGSGTAPTGTKYYNLSGQSVTANSLVPGDKYIISYWSNGGACIVSGTQSVKTGRSSNGWTYYEHTVTGVSSATVSGTTLIDELRMYPFSSQMTTYTYDPAYGVTSECSVNNNIQYYEYDSYGRVYIIRDQDRNILKKICYNYSGAVINCN